MRIRVLTSSLIVATAGALLPLGTLTIAQAASPTATPAAAESRTTTIVVRAHHCKNCRVVGVWTPRTAGIQTFYTGDVVAGRAVLRVPSRQTRGMLFTVVNPRARGKIHGLPLVALKYKGMRTGSDVTPTRAQKARRAKVCWGGTAESRVVLKLRTRRDTALESIGSHRYWLSETAAATGAWRSASRGGVGIRDGYGVCG